MYVYVLQIDGFKCIKTLIIDKYFTCLKVFLCLLFFSCILLWLRMWHFADNIDKSNFLINKVNKER